MFFTDLIQLLLLTLLLLGAAAYLWIKQRQTYWRKRNILSEDASIFYFGRGKHLAHYMQAIYMRYKDCGVPFIGAYTILSPAVLTLDLDLIKNVFIADFDHFPDRGFYHNVVDDPLSANIFRLEGDVWKRLRAKLTPTFSSGKMKFMFSTVVAVGERFVDVMSELTQEEHHNELQMRDLCARFTTDVIGSVAFGLECNSLREPSTEFRLKADKAFAAFNVFLDNLGNKFPKLFHRLHVKAFPGELNDFYTKIIADNIEYRERHNIRRNDFLDILIELKSTKVDGNFVLTLEEIVAQAFVFFIGGFETSSSTMTYCLYELSKNQEVQDKVRRNILDTLAMHNNQLSYECLKEMRYLEQTFFETLRIYPVGPTLRRITRKPYAVPNTPHTIEPGVAVIIPVYGIHHNPDYYPNPEKFDPDRFAPEELQKRHPMCFLPFGAGPRGCIAERFGKMQTLIGLAMLLKNFRFTASPKTPQTLEFNVREMRILSVKGDIT